MEDKMLAHLCSLGAIAVMAIRDPEWDLRQTDDREYEGNMQMLRILADAFVELMNRQGMKPRLDKPIPVRSRRTDLLDGIPMREKA